MATAVSIAIRRDAAQARIQAAAQALAKRNGMGEVDLAPRHKQPDIQNAMTLEGVADFLEVLAAKPAPVAVAAEPAKPRPPKPSPRKV